MTEDQHDENFAIYYPDNQPSSSSSALNPASGLPQKVEYQKADTVFWKLQPKPKKTVFAVSKNPSQKISCKKLNFQIDPAERLRDYFVNQGGKFYERPKYLKNFDAENAYKNDEDHVDGKGGLWM